MTADALDVARLRADCRGLPALAHLNNAGAALLPAPVVDRVVAHLRTEETAGGYEAADAAADELTAVPDAVAALVGCHRDDVALCDSATRAWQTVVTALPLRQGQRVLTSTSEYASNVLGLTEACAAAGAVLQRVPDDPSGQLDVAALTDLLDDDVALVAVNHVPSQSGLVNPAEAIGRAVRERSGALYLLDACQSAGQLPLDVAALGCDVLTATGRKYLRAPRGTGVLVVNARARGLLRSTTVDLAGATWQDDATFALRPDARRYQLWESDVAARLGLGVALRYALDVGPERAWERIAALAGRLRRRLEELDGVTVQDPGAQRCGIVTFTVAGWSAVDVRDALRRVGVNTGALGASTARWDMGARGLDAVVRASVHYYNDDGDLDRCVAAVAALPR